MKFLGILAAALPLAAQQQPAPNYKVNTTLVRLLVTVKDALGALVGSLDAKDFRVEDCGVPQTIAIFERQTEMPLSIAVLMDASGSTRKDLPYEITSLEKFFKALVAEGNPQDAAALYSFNYDVTLLQNFTRQPARLVENLKILRPNGGTSLYDAIALSSRELSRRDGRHVIVIVTDGGDTTSRTRYSEALEGAHLADAVIYPILVVPITNDAGRNLGGEHALATLAESTGGRVFQPSIGALLDQAFTEILRDLRTQYLIAYYPRNLPENPPRFHPVHIEVLRPNLRPSSRTGYYGTSIP
ncbi:MAG TPA: VWA domain-containing protein [Bryobacteraceae bacterium]|nr:VWA domain-containing protein [Bryobacteraceae bacterium]